jgi:hypothetical protein
MAEICKAIADRIGANCLAAVDLAKIQGLQLYTKSI